MNLLSALDVVMNNKDKSLAINVSKISLNTIAQYVKFGMILGLN